MKTAPRPYESLVFRYKRPPLSGNTVNGLGEAEKRRARLVFHWSPGRKPHPWMALDMHFTMVSGIGGPKFGWGSFIERICNMWQLRRADGPVAAQRREISDPAAMAAEIKEVAKRLVGECVVGIAEIPPEAVLEGGSVPYKYAITIGIPMRRAIMVEAPAPRAATEVMRAYRYGGGAAVRLAERIRAMGWPAKAFGETKTTDLLHIPVALKAGIGQLGKHGSMISRDFGSNFRLVSVATDLPLATDAPVDIGVDDLCASCRRCTLDCPAGAISDKKQLVRGERKWYVDFDRCAPYFSETGGCAICIEACPWSEPGRGFKLSDMLLAKRKAKAGAAVAAE
ncbi:MAG: 4Fe-4S dicluster domain-containing protein [Rhodospirillaceae bacterium]|nr:4Fe-4S dicluster domain-containing protein [Rhodospirillaceae bacterium]